jgi:hypothetical protein
VSKSKKSALVSEEVELEAGGGLLARQMVLRTVIVVAKHMYAVTRFGSSTEERVQDVLGEREVWLMCTMMMKIVWDCCITRNARRPSPH